jgi:hypothetical protein
MTKAFDESKASKDSVSKFISIQDKDDHLFCIEYNKQPKTYIINIKEMKKLGVKRSEEVRRWDFLKTFKPPENLSIESGQIWSTEVLNPGSIEYDYVARCFTSTFYGKQAKNNA